MNPLNAYLQSELDRLRTEWTEVVATTPNFPAYSWEDLAEVLLDCTSTPAQELLIRGALSALVKTAAFKPPLTLLREVLMLAASASDQNLLLLLGGQEEQAMG